MPSEAKTRKLIALTTLVEQIGVPEMRRDVNNAANLRWLGRNLGTFDHPLVPTARQIVRWCLRND